MTGGSGLQPQAAQPHIGFGLDEATFRAWWSNVVLAEDASEFVHFHQGTMDGARLVCALGYLAGVEGRAVTWDLIVRAYLIARNISPEAASATKYKYEAQQLYESDAVEFLRDRIIYRAERIERERILARTTAKIHELFDRAAAPKTEAERDDAAERAMNGELHPPDYEAMLATERLALDAGLRFVAASTKEKALDQGRRDKRSLQRAITEGDYREKHALQLPGPEEARQFLVMLREAMGAEQFAAIVAEVEPKALP